MHSNLTPILAQQHLADLHERAAKYRTQQLSQPQQPSVPRPARRHLNALRLPVHPFHRRRTA